MSAKHLGPQNADPVFKENGLPFLVNGKKVVLNDRAVAVKFATEHTLKFNTNAKTFERYDNKRGLWVAVDQIDVEREMDRLLIHLGEAYGQQDFVKRIAAAKLSSVCKMMRSHGARVELESIAGLVHVRNGVVDLNGRTPKLLKRAVS